MVLTKVVSKFTLFTEDGIKTELQDAVVAHWVILNWQCQNPMHVYVCVIQVRVILPSIQLPVNVPGKQSRLA